MKYKIDTSAVTVLGLCHSCSARFLATSYERALERLVQHGREVHPGEKNEAADRYYQKRGRDRKKAAAAGSVAVG